MDRLRETVQDVRLQVSRGSAPGGNSDEKEEGKEGGEKKEKPYDMPSTHGDYNTAWYDLPAANLMQHIVPNSTKPIKGSVVEPLRFIPGPADGEVAAAVKMLIDDSHKMWGESEESEEAKYDLDSLGQHIIKDELGNRKIKETYYGWSEEFARKMARKKKARNAPLRIGREDSADRDMDRSYSSERSMSPPTGPRRMGLGGDRPRGGDGGMGYGGGGRDSRSRTRSRSGSRSRGRGRGYGGGDGYQGGNAGYGGGMGPPRGRGRSSRSATPDDMPRGLGY